MQELHDLSGPGVAEKDALIPALFLRAKANIAQAALTLASGIKRIALAVSTSTVALLDKAGQRVGTHSSFLRVFASASATLICAVLSVGDTRAQVSVPDPSADPGAAPRALAPAPLASAVAPAAPGRIVSMDVGVATGRYTNVNPPSSNGQFGTLTVTQPDDWSATGSLGHSERFGDSSVDYGGSFNKILKPGVDASVGLSSGTGDFIAQRYRFDASLRTALLLSDRSLLATAGYRRFQSKGPNSSDGINGNLAWYVGGHWLLGAGVDADWGHPGNELSTSYSASATRYEYKRWYIGATVRKGYVAYNMVGPNLTLVNYRVQSLSVGGSWWWDSRNAISLNADYGDTDFYIARAVTIRWFHEFR